MGKGENVTARILVARNQMGCLADESGKVASDISTASGVEIQLLGAGLIPNCTVEDDKVVQVGHQLLFSFFFFSWYKSLYLLSFGSKLKN